MDKGRFSSLILIVLILSFFNYSTGQNANNNTVVLIPAKDASVKFSNKNSSYADKNYGDKQEMSLYSSNFGGDITKEQILIDFGELPVSSRFITSAKLQLSFPRLAAVNHGENEFKIYNCIKEWNESKVTWNNKPAISNSALYIETGSTVGQADYKIDVTNLLKSNSSNHVGFYLMLVGSAAYGKYSVVNIASREYKNKDKRPQLIIKYEQ
jgi:hypothetical protein